MSATLSNGSLSGILALVRLGDLDHCGWWRSHGLDETGSFLLGRSFSRTWAATAMELSMVSARVRHDEALGRKDAIHLFSDEMPFYRLVHSWLLDQKLEDDLAPFEPFRTQTTDELTGALPPAPEVERRAAGLFVGTVSEAELKEPHESREVLAQLLGAYRTLRSDFLAPYVDLVP